MKLLYLMTEPFGIGGVQSDILTLSEDLTKKGHEVFVATTTGELLEELKSKGARHLDIDFNGKPMTKTAQVRMCGNSVCPPLAAAIVRANLLGDSFAQERVA